MQGWQRVMAIAFLSAGAFVGRCEAKAASPPSESMPGRQKKEVRMIERLQVYRCDGCGNILVEVLYGGKGNLVCCKKPMKLAPENVGGLLGAAHLPVLEKMGSGVMVKVGKTAHPMVETHYIRWIEVISKDKIYRRFLKPGAAPQAVFAIDADEVSVARAYCNLHGLWKGEW